MSDLKRTCPACKSHTSAIGLAFIDGEPCPVCGLPADAAESVDSAVARGADRSLADRTAAAERRAAVAEAEAARYKATLDHLRRQIEEFYGIPE